MLNFGTQPDFASCCWVKVGNENVIYFLGVVRFPWFVGFFNVAKFIKSLCFFRLRLFLWDLVGQLPLFDYFVQPMYSLLPMRYMLQSHFLHPTCLIVKFPWQWSRLLAQVCDLQLFSHHPKVCATNDNWVSLWIPKIYCNMGIYTLITFCCYLFQLFPSISCQFQQPFIVIPLECTKRVHIC
jgi:hypothetical protein